MNTGFLYHERYFWHDTGSSVLGLPMHEAMQPIAHPESAESKRRVKNLIEVSGLLDQLTVLRPHVASEESVLRYHSRDYIEHLKQLSDGNGGVTGEEVQFGRGSYEIALLSAGGVIASMDAVLNQSVKNAYALVRPPGHHAEAELARGFCMLGNIPIAIKHAQTNYGLKRIAVVDWDVHHGNGTESAFYDDASVLTMSIHEEGNFPVDTGALEDNGVGEGLGFNINVPLPPGSGKGAYFETFESVILPALYAYRPEMIIVASGFDASRYDPLGRMLLSSQAYRGMTAYLMDAANDLCDGKLLVVHEGGYSAEYVPFCALAVVEQLAGIDTNTSDPFCEVTDSLKYQALQTHQEEVIRLAERSADLLKSRCLENIV